MQGYELTQEIIDLFWSKVDKTLGDDACWQWMDGLHMRGYGRMRIKGKRENAHRIAWLIANGGDIPKGLYVCHTCDNRACCNPAHLYLGTPKDNVDDMVTRGRIRRGPVSEHKKVDVSRKPVTINHIARSLAKLRSQLTGILAEIETLESSLEKLKTETTGRKR